MGTTDSTVATGSGRIQNTPANKPGSRPTKFGLLGASFETNNLGVSALTDGAIGCALQCSSGASVILLDFEYTAKTYQYSLNKTTVPVALVNMRLSKNPFLRNHILPLLALAALVRLAPTRRLKLTLANTNRVMRAIYDTEVFGAVCGGDSFSDIYGLWRFVNCVLPMILVQLAGKPLVLLPQTLGPFKSRMTRAVARAIMNRATRIYSRDYESSKEMEKVVKPATLKKIRFAYDLGFCLEPREPGRVDVCGFNWEGRRAKTLVGLNLSGLLAMGGYSRQNMFGLLGDYETFVQRAIEFFTQQEDVWLLLVPHVFGGRATAESDVGACERAFARYANKCEGRLGCLRGSYDQREIKYIIGQCDFFIGSRMHACIAALSQGIPAVGVAYSRKFAGVFRTIGMEGLVADASAMSADEIMALIQQAYLDRDRIKQELKERMPGVKQVALGLFDSAASR